MNKEKIVLSFIAVLIGLFAAGVAFYLYQSTKVLPPSATKTVRLNPSPSPVEPSSIFISLSSPKDEEVLDSRTLSISGKTIPKAVVLISTQTADQVLTPAGNGDFSTTITLSDGQNVIEIRAIDPVTGEEAKVIRTVTYSTESF